MDIVKKLLQEIKVKSIILEKKLYSFKAINNIFCKNKKQNTLIAKKILESSTEFIIDKIVFSGLNFRNKNFTLV